MDQEPHPVTSQVDRFLTFYEYSPESVQEARDTLSYFEHMVGLAVQRAVARLYIPDNVIPFPRGEHTPDSVA